ncbi:MAG: histidine kinase [Clostridia bacterium]|nr:histidine kinase [Clostridia bacterium]
MDAFTAINIAIEFVAVLLVFATIIGTIALSKKEKKDMIRFVILMLLLGLSSLINGLYFVFKGREGESIKILVFLFKSIKIAAGLWLVAGVNGFILSLFGSPKKWYRAYKISVYALMSAMTILLVINVFTHFMYYVDENNVYRRNSAFFIIHLVEGLVWAVDTVLFFLNRKTLSKQVQWTFYISLFFLVVTTVLQFVFPQIAFYDIMIALSIIFLLFGEQIQMREQLAKRDEQLLNQKVKLLQRQVSPHFIYNALTAIQTLPGNPEETKKAIGDFAKYLRSSLINVNDNTTLIPFKKELENVQIYFRLEKIRFGKSLQVEYDIRETEFDLPAMCVQILAENAVKHGVSVRREGGTVRISTKREGDDVIISVEDDGVGFDVNKQMDSTHIGIDNVRDRLRTMVGGELLISSEPGKGTVASIRFPLK